jgi:hypothetical protein
VALEHFHVHHENDFLLLLDCAYLSVHACHVYLFTIAIDLSFILDLILPCLSHLFGGSSLSGISFLIDHPVPQQLIVCLDRSSYMSGEEKKLSMYGLCSSFHSFF